MPALPTFLLFLFSAFILLITPGPAVLYIVTRSMGQGRRAGIASVLGIETGNFCHVLAATFGLSVILQASDLAFSIVKYLGASYLIFLGIHRLLAKSPKKTEAIYSDQSFKNIYLQGIVVAVLNPKTALFFLSFLPQFVNTERGSITFQLFILGCIFIGMAILTDGLYSIAAGKARDWLSSSPAYPIIERYVLGFVYLGLGIAALFAIKNIS